MQLDYTTIPIKYLVCWLTTKVVLNYQAKINWNCMGRFSSTTIPRKTQVFHPHGLRRIYVHSQCGSLEVHLALWPPYPSLTLRFFTVLASHIKQHSHYCNPQQLANIQTHSRTRLRYSRLDTRPSCFTRKYIWRRVCSIKLSFKRCQTPSCSEVQCHPYVPPYQQRRTVCTQIPRHNVLFAWCKNSDQHGVPPTHEQPSPQIQLNDFHQSVELRCGTQKVLSEVCLMLYYTYTPPRPNEVQIKLRTVCFKEPTSTQAQALKRRLRCYHRRLCRNISVDIMS